MKIDTISLDDYFDRIPDVINKKYSSGLEKFDVDKTKEN